MTDPPTGAVCMCVYNKQLLGMMSIRRGVKKEVIILCVRASEEREEDQEIL